MWWLRRSIRTTSASACRSACAAASPAKPPPTITTRLRCADGASMTALPSSGRVSANIALMGSPLFLFSESRRLFRLASTRCNFAWHGRTRTLGAQFEEAEQNLIPLRLQFLDGARADLCVEAIAELALDLG